MKDRNTISWQTIHHSLDEKGYALVSSVLSKEECESLVNLYPQNDLYRSIINMQRYRFGKGEYKYFHYPLPGILQEIRESFFPPLSELANEWMKRLSINTIFPSHHEELIRRCHDKGQERPTPLILRYETGGYNTLHQDLYGEVYFPFQVVFVLSEAGKDFDGGEFVIIEQLPRAQSKAEVIHLKMGDALIFTTNFRPVKGTRGYYRAKMKHGISQLRSGVRYAVGVIFHDAA
jgi:uncharacterized protein